MTLVTDRIAYAELDEPQSLIGRVIDATRRHVRITIALSFLIILACFAGATGLQMRRDYNNVLALAGRFVQAQAEIQANSAAEEMNRLAAMGAAYMNVLDGFGAGYVIETAEGARLLNVGLTDRQGRFMRAMKGEAESAAPLAVEIVQRLQAGPVVAPYSDAAIGSSPVTLFFPADENSGRIVVMPIDPKSLLPKQTLGGSALFLPNGLALAVGEGFDAAPPSSLLANLSAPATRQLEQAEGKRIISVAPVPGWPLVAVSSVQASAALGSWYGSLPLYLFVIMGPALVGAALAVLLVSEFERADRARSALVSLKILQSSRKSAPRVEPALKRTRDDQPPPGAIGMGRFR
jgi:hypothetical protein